MIQSSLKIIFFISLFFIAIKESLGQDISLFSLGNTLHKTYINPAANLDDKWNISLGNIHVELLTDGPTFDQLTAKNAQGKRYIHPDKWQNNVKDVNLVSAAFQLHTLDLGVKLGNWTFMAGHAFRTAGTLTYTDDLLKLVANGNGPYINQTLEIGPVMDYMVFNELYIGVQKKFNRFTVGVKAKGLFGVSNFRTDEPKINYKTRNEFYQWEFDVDYSVRSSSALRIDDITNITFNPSGFTFDHFFYNNLGLAFDIGVNMELSSKFNIFWSALDLGFIKWDYLPRNYVSKGKYTFEGIDPITYINDTSGFNFKDSITQFIPFTTTNEEYTTTLNNRFYLGGSYVMSDAWSFFGLVRFNRSFAKSNAQLSLSAIRSWKWVETGLSYTVTNGNLFNLGALLRFKINPLSAFVATDNVIGLFSLFDQKLANVRGGIHVAF